MGYLVDIYSRKWCLLIFGFLMSLIHTLIYLTHNFIQALFPRMVSGFFYISIVGSYSYINDAFPESMKTIATSMISLGIDLGVALSALSTFLNDALGWRNTILIIGCLGMALSLSLVFMKEPIRSQYRDIQTQKSPV
mmetsp:Transcript_13268/g.13066  ORF Transcript_13268/g.13066 Transcript_13268/m.13066 type:complete len:137 (+) Transcript_13268:334-744(+)